MTESERAEYLLGIRSVQTPFRVNEFGKSELETYKVFLAWIDGPFMAAIQRLAERIEEFEAKVLAARDALENPGYTAR